MLTVCSAEVVPGDICILKVGDTVPADLRLFETMNLNCDEKSLTGEAEPVEKTNEDEIQIPGSEGQVATSEDQVGIADRLNMAYATTTVTKGRGRGIVVFTGMSTEVGKIAASTTKKPRKAGRSMNAKKYGKTQPIKGLARRTYDVLGKFLGLTEGTPLQKLLARMAYLLFGFAIILAIVVFAVNRFDVTDEVAIYAISTGIAIIPESLVAVLTITMVVGMTVMRKANVVIRDLSALEALGGVTNICSDKTGTLTQGAMIAKNVWLPRVGTYYVKHSTDPNNPTQGTVVKEEESAMSKQESATSGSGTSPEPDTSNEKTTTRNTETADMTPALEAFLEVAALCNLATVKQETTDSSQEPKWKTTGEPTEIALQVFANRFELGKKELESNRGWKQQAEFPFDSTIKRMSVVYRPAQDKNSMIFTKGAVERVLDLCSTLGFGENATTMTDELKTEIIQRMDDFAGKGQRVLAVASRAWDGDFAASMRKLGNDGTSPE